MCTFNAVVDVLLLSDLSMMAQVDTGARYSSLDAVDLELIRKNGEVFANFTVKHESDGMEASKVFRGLRATPYKQKEVLIELPVQFSSLEGMVFDLTLKIIPRAREKFKYRMTLGTDAFQDVWKHYGLLPVLEMTDSFGKCIPPGYPGLPDS